MFTPPPDVPERPSRLSVPPKKPALGSVPSPVGVVRLHSVPPVDAEPTRPSWLVPGPPLSEPPGATSAPSSAWPPPAPTPPALSPSLLPGASDWPQKLATSSPRLVPLWLTCMVGLSCLGVGFLLGWSLPEAAPRLRLQAGLGRTMASGLGAAPAEPGPAESAGDPGAPSASLLPVDVLPSVAAGVNTGARPSRIVPAPAVPDDGAGSRQRLSSGEIQRTVHRYQPAVRHGCWQRQLESRAATAPNSARVVVTLTIAPSGKVSSVSASEEAPGYPGLGGCIAGKVRGWSFPQATETTTAQIPFVFAVQ